MRVIIEWLNDKKEPMVEKDLVGVHIGETIEITPAIPRINSDIDDRGCILTPSGRLFMMRLSANAAKEFEFSIKAIRIKLIETAEDVAMP
jgi:hypothetical protein